MARLRDPAPLGVLAVAMTSILALVACRATGETDITPGGPLGKIMQLTYGVLIPQSSTANLQTAAITASASLSSADPLNDLKSCYLLGANPRRQFLAQGAGILTGTIATTLCYFVLVPDASVLTGTDTKAPAFPAPGAQQRKAVAGAVFGEIATRVNKPWAERYIVAIAAGGIAGESIVGVLVEALNNFVPH